MLGLGRKCRLVGIWKDDLRFDASGSQESEPGWRAGS
jgi:hypothetical protein